MQGEKGGDFSAKRFEKYYPYLAWRKAIYLEGEVLNLINVIVVAIGIIFLGLIVLGVYNVVVRKKRVDNMYTPFDDATRGTKKESDRVSK